MLLISIPKHQYESAKALGMSELQIYLHIVMPQTLRRLIPLSMESHHKNDQDNELDYDDRVVEVLKLVSRLLMANRTSSPNAAFGDFCSGICLILYCMLADQYVFKILGKEMGIIWRKN